MKNIRKLLCAVLAIAVLCASVIPAFAANDKKPTFDSDWSTLYMLDKTGESYSIESININNISKDTVVSSPKSSNKSIVSIYSLDMSSYSEKYYEYDEDYENYYGYLYLRPRKVGSATVSIKIDGKTYSKKVTVSKYVNPVKSFVVDSISSKDVKSAFNQAAFSNCKLTKNAKAGTVKVAAASGWKITSVYWSDNDAGENYEYYSWKNGTSSVQMHVPAMSKNKTYYITANFRNVKTKGTIRVQYAIND